MNELLCFPHSGTSPSPLIMWSPEPAMQPPSNEAWPKEEPVDVEMQPSPMVDLSPAPLPDHSLQPPSLPDALFASPEMWISSLPSEC